MYKPDSLTRRGSLRSLRSAPILSTVLESTLSLTRIHPITSLELPGLNYAFETQSATHHRELASSLRSGIAVAAAVAAAAAESEDDSVDSTSGTDAGANAGTSRPGITSISGGLSAGVGSIGGRVKGRLTGNAAAAAAVAAVAAAEHKRNIAQAPKRVLSRKLKSHVVADTVKQYISRAQRTAKKGSKEQQQPNMEFLRGVYAFMQVSRSSNDYGDYDDSNVTTPTNYADEVPAITNVNTTGTIASLTRTTTTTTTTLNNTENNRNSLKITQMPNRTTKMDNINIKSHNYSANISSLALPTTIRTANNGTATRTTTTTTAIVKPKKMLFMKKRPTQPPPPSPATLTNLTTRQDLSIQNCTSTTPTTTTIAATNIVFK